MAKQSKGASNKGAQVNKNELGQMFGVSLPTIDGWMRNGCPIVQRGGAGRAAIYNTADVAAWLQLRAREEASGTSTADEAELRRRKLAAEAEKAELDLAKAKSEVAPVQEFERATAMLMAAIRNNVMQVPARAVLQLLGETDEMTFKIKLRAELALALETAAETEFDLTEEDEELMLDE